ncbi:CigA protein [Backusella circina FSU 941]|nr:CigA protein [Backusella circina FSU 941]
MKTRGKNTVALGTLLMVAVTWLLCYQYQRSVWPKKIKKSIPVIFPKSFELHQPMNGEKFLSYLPHSGFHNQRIELENALLLAAYLNRTLLVPPVFLASPSMPWLRYEKLYERLLLQTKDGLEDCVSLHPNMPLPSECLNNFKYTNIPWTFFFNLTDINTVVPLVFREEINYEWLYSHLEIKRSDIYFFKDRSPYEYQIRDDMSLDLPLDRFNSSVDLEAIKEIKHRVLHFGSLFGSYRILAETEAHAELLRTIRSKMIFRNPVLFDAAKKIVDQLGGTGSFVGMHIRVGDGIFKRTASILVDDIYHDLIDKFTDLDVEQVARYEGGYEQHDHDRTENTEYEVKLRNHSPIDNKKNYARPITVHHSEPLPTMKAELAKHPACQRGDAITSKFRNTVLYIATDAPKPREHPLLQKLFRVFPCVFTLDDFNGLEEVKRLEVVQERVKLESYLIPMVDAIISAHGHTFMGTPHSTFTSYIERQLHPIYNGGQVQVMGLEEYLALE